jgi:integrase
MLPEMAAQALERQEERQEGWREEAEPKWKDTGLVFTSKNGTELDASHVRRSFKDVTDKAGLGRDWTPRELPTSFVSVMSASGAPIEKIARVVGHTSTTTTEEVYRKQIDQAAMSGPEIMDQILRPLRKVRRPGGRRGRRTRDRTPARLAWPGEHRRSDPHGQDVRNRQAPHCTARGG